MRLAFASDDGKTISAHFGKCSCFIVYSVEEGKVTGKEIRQMPSTDGAQQQVQAQGQGACHSHGQHGHQDRVFTLKDCAAVVSLGIGPGAAQSLQAAGIRPFVLPEAMDAERAALMVASGAVEGKGSNCSCCCAHGRGRHGRAQ